MTENRILVFRLSSLGDVALTVPVVLTVLNQNPEVKLIVVTPLFMHSLYPKHERLELIDFDKKAKHKGVSGLFTFYKSLKNQQFDAIADLHNVLRTKILSKLFGFQARKVVAIYKNRKARKNLIKSNTKTPLRHTSEKYADVFRALGLKVNLYFKLKNFLHEPVPFKNQIGVAPFARHEGKMYSLEKMKAIVQHLAKENEILIFGAKDELKSVENWEDIPNVKLCIDLRLKEELKVISRLQLMISMDSANMHLASLVGIPVVSLWGVTHPFAGFLGYGQSMKWVVQDESCTWRPTSIYGNVLGPKDNPNGFSNISISDVLDKVNFVQKSIYE